MWRYLLPFFSLLCLQRFPAFPRSCDAMAAAFQHFGAWTAPTCNPSAHHPSRTPLSPPPWSIPSRRPLSLRSLHHQHPHPHHHRHDLHHHQRRNYRQHNCILSLRQSRRSAGYRKRAQVFRHEKQSSGRLQPWKQRETPAWEKGKVKTGERARRQGDRWGTCQTPAVSQLPFSRLGTV